MKIKNLIASGIFASSLLTGCDQIEEKPEIITQEITAKIITEKTGNSVKNILEIDKICENQEISLKKYDIKNNTIILEYNCENTSENLQLNGVTQMPPIPGIPLGAPVPNF